MNSRKVSDSRRRARAVQIIRVRDDSTLELDEEALKSVLLQEPFKDMQVVVVSVAGKYRQGKSFLLSFFLRFLKAQGSEGWLEKSDSVTDGFQWKAGPVRCTTGILIWSEPLIVSLPSGDKVAVLLMDTQGTDDIGANVQQDVPIFALSALLSSVLVFNVRDVGNNDLDSLRLFLDYGRLAAKAGGIATKPFQDLHFLVRDWNSPKSFGYGFKGGDDYFKHIADQVGGGEVKDALRMAFSKVSCFLMPHPGMIVAGDEFEGLIEDVDTKFLEYLQRFVSQVLGSKHLAIKEVIGRKVTVAELVPILTNYFIFFEDGKCPAPETLFETNMKMSYMHALDVAKKYLDSQLATSSNTNYIENLEVELQSVASATRQTFLASDKLGQSDKYDEKYLVYLDEYIKSSLELRIGVNEVQKEISIIEEQARMQAEKAGEELRAREEEIERMKESEVGEKEAKRAEIEALKESHRQENLAKQNEIALVKETYENNKQMMENNHKLIQEKAILEAKAEFLQMKLNDQEEMMRTISKVSAASSNASGSRITERYSLRTPATAVGGGVGGALGLVVGTAVGGPVGAGLGSVLGGALGTAAGEVAVVAVDVAQEVGTAIWN